jgi:phage-related protein
MPETDVVLYLDDNGSVPLREWLLALPTKAADKCLARLKRLEQLGHELRRPEADFLRDGIYELRASYQGRQYRMLYFFAGKQAVVVSHGLVKERAVPARDIDKAVERKKKYELDPSSHTFRPER